jgi:glycosyltransferase involved in cell wall biosynthesis
MIIYVSDSVNSKKNGGSSTSGFEFLQILRIKYNNVVLITSDSIKKNEIQNNFYDYQLNNLHDIIIIKRNLKIFDKSLRSFIRPFYYFFKDFNKRKNIDLTKYLSTDEENILYINSWSPLYDNSVLLNMNIFSKVCIVRGSPESFIYQSFELDKKEAIENAAKYLKCFNSLIYVSNNGLNDWTKILKANISSYYLPNSINEFEINNIKKSEKNVIKKQIEFSAEFYNIVIVGSVQKRKAQDILLKNVKELISIKPNLKFHIVGLISKTWGGVEIFNEIINSKYSKYFIFHGHSDNVISYMYAADLLIFTSYAEAFPRTVAEYMAIGGAIIASDVSGVNEMIVDGVNGLLFNPYDNEEFIKKFNLLANNSSLAIKLSEIAKNDYFNKFSKKVQISKALEIFDKIC